MFFFLIHDPPYGFFDKVLNKDSPLNNKHVGDKYFLQYIKKYKPSLVISGHMHEYQGLKKLGKSTIIATGSAKEGKAVIIDINPHTGKINNIDFIGKNN
jgi:Icc-related predicted phosphoesterase